MTAIAWAIIIAAVIYIDAQNIAVFKAQDYEGCRFYGGMIFVLMFVTLICTVKELSK